MDQVNTLLLLSGVLLFLGVLASTLSARLGLPFLLIFLVVGMLAGEDGPGGIRFDDFGACLVSVHLKENAELLLNTLQLSREPSFLTPGEIELASRALHPTLALERAWAYRKAKAGFSGLCAPTHRRTHGSMVRVT